MQYVSNMPFCILSKDQSVPNRRMCILSDSSIFVNLKEIENNTLKLETMFLSKLTLW